MRLFRRGSSKMQPVPATVPPRQQRISTQQSRYAHLPRPGEPLRPLCPAGNSKNARWEDTDRAYVLPLCTGCSRRAELGEEGQAS